MTDRCIALINKNHCAILNIKKCVVDNCSFFKTYEQEAAEQVMVNKRLASLPAVRQQHIADKYFAGQMPWLGESN